MDSARLWRDGRHDSIGTVELDDDHHRLFFHIDDAADRARVKRIFEDTGNVSSAWELSGSDEWQQEVAEPLTSHWFKFVVVNRLSGLGYRVDFRSGRDKKGPKSQITGSL